MTSRSALRALASSCALVAAAYVLAFLPGGAPPSAAWGLVLGSAGALASLMALGAARAGRVRRGAVVACALTFVVVAAAFGAALLLPANEGPHAPLLLGLPVRTAIVIYGVGLVPLVFLPVIYALQFDADAPTDDELERIRRAARERDA